MKIEKISDNQIRCTLSKEDLIDRELKLSELAYGSEKAKELFRDMIQQAAYEFGFEVGDIPLMIEAIPVSTDSLVLVITKVEDPDELDTRFSNFSSINSSDHDAQIDSDDDSYADEIINCLEQIENIDDVEQIQEILDDANVSDNKNHRGTGAHIIPNIVKIYSFNSLNEITDLANVLLGFYHGENILYKNPLKSIYYLLVNRSEHSPEEFNKVCNIMSEYGKSVRSTYASQSYFDEHYEVIIKDNALQILSVL